MAVQFNDITAIVDVFEIHTETPIIGVHTIQANITPPASEGYGGMLLISITRTASKDYASKLAILDIDAHTIVDRKGSVNEGTD